MIMMIWSLIVTVNTMHTMRSVVGDGGYGGYDDEVVIMVVCYLNYIMGKGIPAMDGVSHIWLRKYA